MKAEDFYAHLDDCDQCQEPDEMGYAELCSIGRELLYEVADELPLRWWRALNRMARQEELEREADANAKFYAGSEEF